ncbi:unnamed protein product [Calypogeia fissa]
MAMASIVCASCSYNGVGISSSLNAQEETKSTSLRTEFFGAKNDGVSLRKSNTSVSSRYMAIEAALSREKKEATVEKARQQLEGAQLVAGIKYSGLTVKQLQTFRKSLPETSTLIVAKNKLIGKAIEGTKWEALKPALKGMNAWLFVHSEEIPAAIKPYRDLQKEFKLDTDFTGAVFEGKFYAPEDFKELESMPTRAELFSRLLGGLQGPATNLVGTLQGPARELVFTLKAYVAKLEEEAGGMQLSWTMLDVVFTWQDVMGRAMDVITLVARLTVCKNI